MKLTLLHKCLLVALMIPSIMLSQTGSLQNYTNESKGSIEEVEFYLGLAKETTSVDIEQAITYARHALQLANNITMVEARAEANELLGDLYLMTNNFQPSTNYLLISSKIYKGLDRKDKLAQVYSKLGTVYLTNNFNLENAQYYFQQLLNIGIEINDQSIIAEAYFQIGGIFYKQDEIDEANYYFREALQLWEHLGNEKGISKVLNSIGEIYHFMGSYTTALDYFNQSLSISLKNNYEAIIANSYKNIGLIKSKMGEKVEAFNYFEQSLQLFEATKMLEEKVDMILIIGDQYMAAGQYTKAFQEFEKAYQIAIRSNHWEHIADAAKGLSRSYDKLKNYQLSLSFFKIYASYTDSITQRQKTDRISDLQMRFRENLQEKELLIAKNELMLSENQNEVNNLKLNLLILSIFFILIISILILNRYRSRIKKERLLRETNAELYATQKELMELDIQSKDNDLMNFALHLAQKNEILQHLQKELKKLPCDSDEESIKRISELSATIKQNLSIKEEYDEFKHKLDQSYYGFFKRLKNRFPNLTKNEEKLCAFLRLNLSSKEIAAINNTSVKAAEMSRYRLRKKMDLDNTVLLTEYLQSI